MQNFLKRTWGAILRLFSFEMKRNQTKFVYKEDNFRVRIEGLSASNGVKDGKYLEPEETMSMSVPIPTSAVASYFLAKAQEHGDLITQLKLQKLVYYAQAWHLALFDQPLFNEELQAWVHGPVAPSLYNQYKGYGWSPITEGATKPNLDGQVCEHLDEIYEVFGGFTAFDLERMTHKEAPWVKARGGLPKDAPSTNVIHPEDMKSYYRQLAKQSNGENQG